MLAGVVAMSLDPQFREYAKTYPVEVTFAALYLFAVFCYNYPVFARSNFARFSIPALPTFLSPFPAGCLKIAEFYGDLR